MNLNIISEPANENQTYDLSIQIFKALTHPARLAILEILRDGEHCVCHLEACLGFRQAYISQQLAVLREAGMIEDRRDGWNIYYRVTDARIFTVMDAVQTMTGKKESVTIKPQVICNCPHCSEK